MIYNSLDIIPYKLFIKIAESGDVSLLSENEKDIDKLQEVWDQLYEEHLSKNQTSESKKIFKLSKEIDRLLTMNKEVLMACVSLRFEFNQDLFDIITGYGYKLSLADTESYHGDIARIEREANTYLIKAENYQNMLPEKKDDENSEYNIDDVMASYSSILGFSIGDFNIVPYNTFRGFEKQVNAKIKAISQSNNQNKN